MSTGVSSAISLRKTLRKSKYSHLTPEQQRQRKNDLSRIRNQRSRAKKQLEQQEKEELIQLRKKVDELTQKATAMEKELRQIKGIPEEEPTPVAVTLYDPALEPIDPHFPREWDNFCSICLVAEYMEFVLKWNMQEIKVKNKESFTKSGNIAGTIYETINKYQRGYSDATMDLIMCFSYLLAQIGNTPHLLMRLPADQSNMKLLEPLKTTETKEVTDGITEIVIQTTDFHVDNHFIYVNGGTKIAIKNLYAEFEKEMDCDMEMYMFRKHQWFWRLCKKQ